MQVDHSTPDAYPFSYASGWLHYIQHSDPSELRALVSIPHPYDEAPLRRIYDAACSQFEEEHAFLDSMVYPLVWMINLMDDGSGYPIRPFHALPCETVQQYASSWGRWVAFVLRLYQRQEEGDLRYEVTMTLEQCCCAQRALDYCNNDHYALPIKRILADMAFWFWRPNNDIHFQHLAADPFDDPTVRFAALINLREDGSFEIPQKAIQNMLQVKFFMRLALLMWSRLEHEEGRATVNGTIERIACGVSRCVLAPFACICIAISCAMTDGDLTVQLPDFLWCSDYTRKIGDLIIDSREFREAGRRLAFLMSIAAGPPSRGPEFWFLRMHNPSYMLRGIQSLGSGRIVFVLYRTSADNAHPTWLLIHMLSSPPFFTLFTVPP
ncbi:hypothetical protein CTheo_8968 [Ceratobasidium theobromae]|uniref:Uncharacterized protein n=1 Tax=Ceratobasidium theobromae TaxID=1582974 RepID=A0A5N5Q7X8_9AGAM|nr:hypothetical protein CTheo_8968 [Ceratobasidium theobromae]